MKRLTKIMTAVTFAFSFPTFGVAASFNCAKASTANEIAICSDDELSTLDETLAAVYKQARGSVSDAKRLKSEQVNWIKSLGTCDGNVACLITAYKSRLSILGLLNGSAIELADPLQNRIAELNEREDILIQRENALTTEMRALNSAIDAFEEEKRLFAEAKGADEVAVVPSTPSQNVERAEGCASGISSVGEKLSLSKCMGFINAVNKAFKQPITFTEKSNFDFAWTTDQSCQYMAELNTQKEHIDYGAINAMSGIQTENMGLLKATADSCNALFDHHLPK